VAEDDRVLYHDTVSDLVGRVGAAGIWPSFEPGGPRRELFFAPGTTKVGIVTCGGLCPGLNDVIRALVMELAEHYRMPTMRPISFSHQRSRSRSTARAACSTACTSG
jgi:hypothetical protein